MEREQEVNLEHVLPRNRHIGLRVLNRPHSTCVYSTTFCSRYCYNRKLERVFRKLISSRDIVNEQIWQSMTGSSLSKLLSRMVVKHKRFRLMARGEAFVTENDVLKVQSFLIHNPKWSFWIPTRAWRSDTMRPLVETLFDFSNHRIMASIDPTTTLDEINILKGSGWSTMYFGDDSATEDRILCPKTWTHTRTLCTTCDICFGTKRVDVHLKNHYKPIRTKYPGKKQ